MKLGNLTIYNAEGQFTPDIRRELVQTVGGVKVVDNGIVAEGEKGSFSGLIKKNDLSAFMTLLTSHSFFTLEEDNGNTRSYCYLGNISSIKSSFKNKNYIQIDFEVWRV